MNHTTVSKRQKSGWRKTPSKRSHHQDTMKKEKKNRPAASGRNKPAWVFEDAKLVLEITPGKKGGQFDLPFGGRMTVQIGAFDKKETVTCCQVAPSDRQKYALTLNCDEFLLSELFSLTTKTKTLRKSICLQLPVYPEPNKHVEIRMLTRRTDRDEWREIEFERIGNSNTVKLDTTTEGIFVVVAGPRRETFDVPVNGYLHNSRLSKQISVRFPKRAVECNSTCTLSVIPLNRDSLPYLNQDFPLDMADLVAVTDYFDIRCSATVQFRRAATVKLPLPILDGVNSLSQDDIVVMHIADTEWQLMEAPLKFTKSAVTFDTKSLSRYCVALASPQRRRRLVEVFRHLKNDHCVTRGDILPFLHTLDKTWTLWFDVVSNKVIEHCIQKRTNQGFRLIKPLLLLEEELVEEEESFSVRGKWRSKPNVPKQANAMRTDLNLIRSRLFELNVGDGVRICNDDPGASNLGLQYEANLPENYRRFLIEPIDSTGDDESHLTGILRIYIEDNSKDGEKCIKAFDFDIAPDVVRAHRPALPQKIAEPEQEPMAVVVPHVPDVPILPPFVEITPLADIAPPPPTKAAKQPPSRSFARLIQPIRPPREAIREAKVLNGHSLYYLARRVEQGLTLAIYLGISDSTITGMGFDALAMGHSLVDITYRILMLWKRRTSRIRNRQVEILADALGDMGLNDIAAILLDRHRQNLALTPECFSIEGVESVD